jgi:HEPN domain-containing protein
MTTLDLAKEWLSYAKSDLNTAKHMFDDVNPKETEISCYHTHQCVEKSLKAYLISKGIDPPHNHDLVELNRVCTVHEASFTTMQQYCIFLNPYGVTVRYPNELVIDDSIAKLSIDYAEKVFWFCKALLEEA